MNCKFDINQVLKKALKLRQKNKIKLGNSFCVFDLADSLGVEVKFVDMKSMEGAFLKDSKTILVSTFRPEGRLRFTCAHELGHFIFGHGDHFDNLVFDTQSGKNKINETISDNFAAFLLMPETTVRSGFIVRGWDWLCPTPIQVYTIACWLGVGYSTLLKHMYFSLRFIEKERFEKLVKIKPIDIKSSKAGLRINSNLLFLDKFWEGRPLDLQVGDSIAGDEEMDTDLNFLSNDEFRPKNVFIAKQTGTTSLYLKGSKKEYPVRVRRKEFIGRSIYRHYEE